MQKSKIINFGALSLCALLLLTAVFGGLGNSTIAKAVPATTRITYLNLTPQYGDDGSDKFEDEQGWYWSTSSKTLTLTNANFQITELPTGAEKFGVKLPENSIIYVPDGTTTTIAIPNLPSVDGETGYLLSVVFGLGNLTITGKGTLHITTGSKDNYGFYAYGIYTTGGNLTVEATKVNVTTGDLTSYDATRATLDNSPIGMYGRDSYLKEGIVYVKGGAQITTNAGSLSGQRVNYGVFSKQVSIINGTVHASTNNTDSGSNKSIAFAGTVVNKDGISLMPSNILDEKDITCSALGMTVYYEMNGANGGVAPALTDYAAIGSQTITVASTNLTKNNYVFKGWSLNQNGTGTLYVGGENLSITNNTTFYAQWQAHTHTYSTDWTNDASGHWHAATCNHLDIKGSFNAHDYEDWVTTLAATCLTAGSKERVCSVCSYKETEVLPALNHNFSPIWLTNGDHHWHACLNDRNEQKDIAAHTFASGACTICALAYDPITITVTGGTINGQASVTVQRNSTVTAIPDTVNGMVFDHWIYQGQLESSNNPLTFIPLENTTLVAIFKTGTGGGSGNNDIGGSGNNGISVGAVVGIILSIVLGLFLIFIALYVLWKFSILKGNIFNVLIRWFDPAAIKVCGLVSKKDRLFTVKGTKNEQTEARKVVELLGTQADNAKESDEDTKR